MTDTSMPAGAPVAAPHLSDTDFEETIHESKTPVLVDFYAEWCGPCKLAAPIIDKLAGEYHGRVLIAKLDTDDNIETARKYNVMSIPTVIMFKDGQEVGRKIGFPGETGYRQMVDSIAGAPAA